MRRQLPQTLLDLFVGRWITRRLRQTFPVEPSFHIGLANFRLMPRLQELLDLFHGRREVMQRKQPVQRIDCLGDQMSRVMRENMNQPGRVNLRIARCDRRIETDQAHRRFFRREQIA